MGVVSAHSKKAKISHSRILPYNVLTCAGRPVNWARQGVNLTTLSNDCHEMVIISDHVSLLQPCHLLIDDSTQGRHDKNIACRQPAPCYIVIFPISVNCRVTCI